MSINCYARFNSRKSPPPQKKKPNHSFHTLFYFINFSYNRPLVRVTPSFNSISFSLTSIWYMKLKSIIPTNKNNFFSNYKNVSLNCKKFSFNFHTRQNFQEIIQFFPFVEVSTWIFTLDKTQEKIQFIPDRWSVLMNYHTRQNFQEIIQFFLIVEVFLCTNHLPVFYEQIQCHQPSIQVQLLLEGDRALHIYI